MTNTSSLLRLPEELLLHIFNFIFCPWVLQMRLRKDSMVEMYYDEPMVQALPSHTASPLQLICKSIHRIVRNMALASFTGTINSFESPMMDRLPARWRHMEARVRKLYLPGTRYILSQSAAFILHLPSLELIELFEDSDLHINLGDHFADSDQNILDLFNSYSDGNADLLLPRIPSVLPLRCNGGHVRLFLHVYFNASPNESASVLDVIYEVGPSKSLHLIDNTKRSIRLGYEGRI